MDRGKVEGKSRKFGLNVMGELPAKISLGFRTRNTTTTIVYKCKNLPCARPYYLLCWDPLFDTPPLCMLYTINGGYVDLNH